MPRKRTGRLWEIRDLRAEQRVWRRRRLVQAIGQFIERYAWDHFVSFTSRYATSSINLLSRFESFADELARHTGQAVPWVAVAEEGWSPVPHVHGFINRTSGLTVDDIEKRWR